MGSDGDMDVDDDGGGDGDVDGCWVLNCCVDESEETEVEWEPELEHDVSRSTH